jgi:acetyltransferase-like isoleucine patch superfamily enzyme
MVGPYCVIADTEALLVDDEPPRAIEIGDDVWLAGRVTVRPGARIGAGAVIGAGSVVEGDIPAWAVVSGAPARVLRIRRGGDGRSADASH